MVKRFIADGIMVRDLEGKIPTIMTHNKKQQEAYLNSLNELAQDSKKYHKMISVMAALYQTTKLTDSTKKMFEMFSETLGFDLEVD